MESEEVWKELCLEELSANFERLFPVHEDLWEGLFTRVLQGDILGAFGHLLKALTYELSGGIGDMKEIFLWLLILGMVSAVMAHFIAIFDKHQVAELSFYFMYLLMVAVLSRCFRETAACAAEAMDNIVMFVRMMLPTYLISVGVVTGSATAAAGYQMMLFLIWGVEEILIGIVLPFINGYLILSLVNAIWTEEKLSLFIDFIGKGIGWMIKGILGLVTGLSLFQSFLTPVIDTLRGSVLNKTLAALPGIGNGVEGVLELALSSGLVIKNGVGIVLLFLLLFLCAGPLLRILVMSVLLKGAAAMMGLVSDKRITSCTNRVGDAGFLLLKTTFSTMLLFLISIAVVITSARRF